MNQIQMNSNEVNQIHVPLKQKTKESSTDCLCSQGKCEQSSCSCQKPTGKIAFMKETTEKEEKGGIAHTTNTKGHHDTAGSKTTIPFWLDDPNVLIAQPMFFPTQSMTYNEQMNAITRLVIVVSLLLFFVYRRLSSLLIGGITLFVICVVQVNETGRIKEIVETFNNPSEEESTNEIVKSVEKTVSKKDLFDEPKTNNPFSNVLLSDYMRNPDKKPAPPIDSPETENTILKKAKETVRLAHPTIPDIAEKLFTNLGDQYEFERSLQPFYSTAATTIPNNQKAFSEFCYGDMISCKEGNLFACARNSGPHTNY